LRIETTNRSQGVGKAGATTRSGSGADFVPAGSGAPVRANAATPAMAVAGLDAILALQAVGGPLEGRKRAIRRGTALLDLLDGIKADLLVGRVSADRLDQLATTLGEMRERTLPGLDAALDDIELRVRVELAKFGRYPAI
jgi:hypothetical protein